MSTSRWRTSAHVHPVVRNQARYDRRRRFLRDFVLRPLGFGLLTRLDVQGLEHIPADGPTIIIMNHIAAIDPFVVTGVITSRYVVPMSKVENMRHPLIGLIGRAWGVYPVRRGEPDRQALASTLALLEQNRPVLIAPEGTRNPALIEARDGTAYLAVKAGAAVVPVGLEGTDRFPATWRRLRRTPITVRVGPAFRFRAEGGRAPRAVLRQMTREMMYQLALLLPPERRGVYADLDRLTTDYLEFVPA